MRWEDERYVRLYTRDTPEWVYLGWEAQGLFMQLLRKVDRAGVMDLGKSGARGLAALLRMPQDMTERALAVLIEDGCVEQQGSNLIVRNFIEAQEASMSPTHRQKESRERRRDLIRSGLDPNQRATVIYFVQSEHGGAVKVGRADDLAKRLQGLATGRPDNLVLLGAVPGTAEDERRVHAALAPYREKGEWFSPSPMVMACARAAVAGATVDDVLRHAAMAPIVAGHADRDADASPVTNRDASQVAGHDSSTVTPIRSDPSQDKTNHSLAGVSDARAPASTRITSAHAVSPEPPPASEPKPPVTPPDEIALSGNEAAILSELRRWPPLVDLATVEVARAAWGNAYAAGQSVAAVKTGIAEYGAKVRLRIASGERIVPDPGELAGYISRVANRSAGDRYRAEQRPQAGLQRDTGQGPTWVERVTAEREAREAREPKEQQAQEQLPI